jgi:hypothetical protein
MSIKNAEQITIYKDDSRYNCQVGACQLQNGEVVVIFNEMRGLMHLDFDSIALLRSTDRGQTFDPSTKVSVWPCTHHFGSDTPSIRQLRDGTLLCNFLMTSFVQQKGIDEDFGPQSERLDTMRDLDGVWLARSYDNGHTWDTAYKASTAPMRYGQPIDEVTELPNGTLLMAAQGQLHARSYQPFHEPVRCFLLRSDNQGVDWEHWSTIAYDSSSIISFSEPSLGRNADGTLICMMRTMHQPRRRHQRMWIAHSTDDGESWSSPRATNLWGYPADLTLLSDGRMLATYGYRREPWGVRGCISEDGLHWDVANEFVIRQGGIAPQQAVPNLYWHIGYPTSIQLDDGHMFTVDHVWSQEPPYVQYITGVHWELGD